MAKKKLSKIKGKDHKEVNKHVVVERKGSDAEVLAEKGSPNDRNRPPQTLQSGEALVGLSKGLTINLGNFESARIDCWISRVCKDGYKETMDALADISTMLDEQLQFESDELK